MPSTNGHGLKRAVLWAILYARVSTDEQARSGYSLAQQLEALREYAAREGYEVLEEVVDPGQSGASLERPGMDRVRDLVAAGGVAVVLAQDRDRIAREPAYHYLLSKELEEHGTKIRAMNDRGDDSPEGELTDGILDQLAKFERAKLIERSRRGRLRRAREGKIIAGHTPDYGFTFNATRDNYVVDEDKMRVVRRIFHMVGVEGKTLHEIKRTLEGEGVRSPAGKAHWATSVIRTRIFDDVYKPHSYEEVSKLVSSEVAAKLDPSERYGIWWYNRHRIKCKQVLENTAGGRRYRRITKVTEKASSEWIAVPVPDSGIPREWVDAAREVIRDNKKWSSAGRRFWELSGGIFCCGNCGSRMTAETVWPSRRRAKKMYFYYKCPKYRQGGSEACLNKTSYRAEKVEPLVWGFVSELLKNPKRLREGLEEMIERESDEVQGDPDREAKVWANKLAAAADKRARFQDMAAEGLISFDELGTKLMALEEERELAGRKLQALEDHRTRLRDLERDKDALLDRYMGLLPETLDNLAPEERHDLYRMLKLRVIMHPDRMLEVSGVLGEDLGFCESEPSSG
jgi:site-specific DNA recombinase